MLTWRREEVCTSKTKTASSNTSKREHKKGNVFWHREDLEVRKAPIQGRCRYATRKSRFQIAKAENGRLRNSVVHLSMTKTRTKFEIKALFSLFAVVKLRVTNYCRDLPTAHILEALLLHVIVICAHTQTQARTHTIPKRTRSTAVFLCVRISFMVRLKTQDSHVFVTYSQGKHTCAFLLIVYGDIFKPSSLFFLVASGACFN